MKRILLLFVTFMIVLSACSADYKAEAKKLIFNYYDKYKLIKSEDDIQLYKAKPYDDGYLILAGRNSGNGYYYSDLLMVSKDDEGYYISKAASSSQPVSDNTTLSKLTYDNKIIIFGVLDKKNYPECTNVSVKLKGGQIINESIKDDTGYIIILDANTEIDDISFCDDKDQSQLSSNSLFTYETKFQCIR